MSKFLCLCHHFLDFQMPFAIHICCLVLFQYTNIFVFHVNSFIHHNRSGWFENGNLIVDDQIDHRGESNSILENG